MRCRAPGDASRNGVEVAKTGLAKMPQHDVVGVHTCLLDVVGVHTCPAFSAPSWVSRNPPAVDVQESP